MIDVGELAKNQDDCGVGGVAVVLLSGAVRWRSSDEPWPTATEMAANLVSVSGLKFGIGAQHGA